jgi:WD40 repeat protein
MALTPDGQKLATGLWNASVKIWEINKAELLWDLKGHTESVHSLAITPDGKTVISGSWDKTIRCWNIDTGECVQVLSGHSEIINAVVTSPDGKHVISVSNDKTLRIWDIREGDCLFTFWADAPLYTIAVNSLTDTIIAGDQSGRVHFLRPVAQR